MALRSWMELISVDDHRIEHCTAFGDPLLTRCRAAGPKIAQCQRAVDGDSGVR